MASTRRAPGALFCDTNVLVRLLTNDPVPLARAAQEALDRAGSLGPRIILSDVVFAELAYVLTEVYELTAKDAGARLNAILDLPGIEVVDSELLRDAISVWVARRLDFTDAYLAALARSTENTGVLSFDRDFDRVNGVLRVDAAKRV